jgi:hypothetical protein
MRHPSDTSLYSLVEQQCGWDLGDLRQINQAVAATSGP